ncbi:hypothetical protein DH2020_046026 [Rehmannia glutinosa]|uniref:C2H2-type domain-containing protein n=1 Tax=Rehmannia glutinosa TaxID=99300 RepID=A0ABR0UCT4_REHGL
MDLDPSKNSDEMIIWGTHDDFGQNIVQTRSYRCTFCKRGFSNAQALGGHMNIHRKDRAKLKEFSRENLLSLDITKSTDCEDSPPHDFSGTENLSLQENQSSDDKNDDLDRDEGRQDHSDTDLLVNEGLIPLFDEGPSGNSGGDKEEVSARHFDKQVVDKVELDLELRLGPHEPQYEKSKPE